MYLCFNTNIARPRTNQPESQPPSYLFTAVVKRMSSKINILKNTELLLLAAKCRSHFGFGFNLIRSRRRQALHAISYVATSHLYHQPATATSAQQSIKGEHN